jgi:endonuclease YncB( thermonuclease family)
VLSLAPLKGLKICSVTTVASFAFATGAPQRTPFASAGQQQQPLAPDEGDMSYADITSLCRKTLSGKSVASSLLSNGLARRREDLPLTSILGIRRRADRQAVRQRRGHVPFWSHQQDQ